MWFRDLAGFDEESPEQVRSLLRLEGTRLHSTVNDRSFEAGVLETPSLSELRSGNETQNGTRQLLKISEMVADVQRIHVASREDPALFQVASQFNLLEMVGPSVTPEQGVGRYEGDPTQGPACAIACGAATIYRNYFVPLDGLIGQTRDRQIDCLSDIGDFLGNDSSELWSMRNGYMLPSEHGLKEISQRIAAMDEGEIEELRGRLRIGIQWGAQVTLEGSEHVVQQAFCSALPIAYCDFGAAQWEPIARLVLEAAYEATLWLGLKNLERNGSPTVYLTWLGGGAFGNPMAWIQDAIIRALRCLQFAELDVRIVSYGRSSPAASQIINAVC